MRLTRGSPSLRQTYFSVFLLGVMLAVVGCGESKTIPGDAAPQVFFPIWEDKGGATPAAQLSGRLVERDRCLLVEDHTAVGTDVYLPLWPDSFHVQGGQPLAVVNEDGIAFKVGDSIVLDGGEWSPRSEAEEIIGQPIPERCVHDPWLTSGVHETE